MIAEARRTTSARLPHPAITGPSAREPAKGKPVHAAGCLALAMAARAAGMEPSSVRTAAARSPPAHASITAWAASVWASGASSKSVAANRSRRSICSPLSACQTDLFDYRTPCRMRCRKRRNTMSPPFRVALAAMAVIVALGSHPASAQRGGRGGFVGRALTGALWDHASSSVLASLERLGPGGVGRPRHLLHGGGRRPRRPGGAGGRAPGEAAEVAQGKIHQSNFARNVPSGRDKLALPFGDRPSVGGPYLYTFDAVGRVVGLKAKGLGLVAFDFAGAL